MRSSEGHVPSEPFLAEAMRTTRLGRRDLLGLGAGAAAAALLAACGGGDDGGDADEAIPQGVYLIARRWPNTSLTPGRVRLPFSLVDPSSSSIIDGGPSMLTGKILDDMGGEVTTFEVPRRGVGQGVPYWTVEAQLDVAGLYSLQLDSAPLQPAAFEILTADRVAMPTIGSTLAPFDTPTFDDARGVEPVCTRIDGPCPFHEMTVAEALASGTPTVFLVGTPAHCATGTCAPGLDFLIEVSREITAPNYVHAEVFADAEGTVLAPVIEAYSLDYEPVIFVADATGTIVERIDIVWDLADLTELLKRALS
jgi:hypothetical protein